MITSYATGADFWAANRAFLETNPYLSVFFKLDFPLLVAADEVNYALRCEQDEKTLLALKVEPYNLLWFGDAQCAPELLDFILSGGYELKNYLCESHLGDTLAGLLQARCAVRYEEALAMDFMEATQETEPSSPDVVRATEDDLDEIFECAKRFVVDCGLLDSISRERLKKSLSAFRLIRENGHIASMASLSPGTDADMRVGYVYTPNAYRGRGYARKVVNSLKNEILASGKIATLNVDRKNPISNHLYSSLGFKRVFSQGEYRKC